LRILIAFLVALSVSLMPALARADVRATKHNLSAFGPGSLKAETETRVCVFCHTPHAGSQTLGMLWNRSDSTATYVPYSSTTLDAVVGQPTGSSKLCLSCHDGTVALGELLSEPSEIGFVGGVHEIPVGSSRIGTDLSDDHPVSFLYDAALAALNPELADPAVLTGAVRLDPAGAMQCTSCHDPHDTGFGKFLVADTRNSDLCLVCHEKPAWGGSSHALSSATWDGTGADPWPHSEFTNVAENACENCHRPHGAGSSAWILNSAIEEDNCLVCHDGGVATSDIQSEFSLFHHHPIELQTGIHTPSEDASMPMTEHVECSDCHDPHSVNDTSASAPLASGPLQGVSGIDSGGNPVASVTYQYEVCFKCHGAFSMSDPPIDRQFLQNDKRLQFDVGNPSYHPIEGIGRNGNVPSLIPPLDELSLIYCTDCHASDAGPGTGGSDPAGPHGSFYPHILERKYSTLDNQKYDSTLYALCFKCHSEQNILNDRSFKEHQKHIKEEDAPCSACHDPHGISHTQGNDTNNSNLINFDRSIVSATGGRLEFRDTGDFRGECYLQCHGKKHDPKRYGSGD